MTFTTIDQSLLGPYSSLANTFIGVGRNRFINGEMLFDQMNGGNALVVNAPGTTYSQDQWFASGITSAGVFSTQRQTSTPPTGFLNYNRITVTTADASPAAGNRYFMRNGPEGTMVRDFLWGTANAKTITLSFWIRCSLTGTFSVAFINSANNRSYVAAYVINATNTWEYKTVTIPGDTAGTWATDNTAFGVRVVWDLGTGSTFQTTAGSWQAGNFQSTSTAVKLISTNGATLDLTGAQLEIGSAATAFEFRPYPIELALCQRYYEKSYALNTAPGTVVNADLLVLTGAQVGTTTVETGPYCFKVTKRITPTIVVYNRTTGSSGSATWTTTAGANNTRTTTATDITTNQFSLQQTTALDFRVEAHFTADAGF